MESGRLQSYGTEITETFRKGRLVLLYCLQQTIDGHQEHIPFTLWFKCRRSSWGTRSSDFFPKSCQVQSSQVGIWLCPPGRGSEPHAVDHPTISPHLQNFPKLQELQKLLTEDFTTVQYQQIYSCSKLNQRQLAQISNMYEEIQQSDGNMQHSSRTIAYSDHPGNVTRRMNRCPMPNSLYHPPFFLGTDE